MWQIMQQPKPDDYVVATGEMRSVRELCDVAFRYVGLDYRDFVQTSDALRRPLEVERLQGDPSKVMAIGWKPEIQFHHMIQEMVDVALVR
jgi:GDPmannose 4,6-dehydratase